MQRFICSLKYHFQLFVGGIYKHRYAIWTLEISSSNLSINSE